MLDMNDNTAKYSLLIVVGVIAMKLIRDIYLNQRKMSKTVRIPLDVSEETKDKVKRDSKAHYGSENVNGYLKYLINKERSTEEERLSQLKADIYDIYTKTDLSEDALNQVSLAIEEAKRIHRVEINPPKECNEGWHSEGKHFNL